MQDSTAKRVLWVLVLVYAIFFSFLLIQKNRILQGSDDTPIYAQTLWFTLHGQPFRTTWLGIGGPGDSFLGLHFSPMLIGLLPLYALWSSPSALLLVQVVGVALSAIPVYGCATHLLRNPAFGLCFAAAHLANPFVQRALFYGFHLESLLFLALTSAAAFLLMGRYRAFAIAAAAAALTREDAFLHLFVLGLFALLVHKRRRAGLAILAASLIGFIIITTVVIPYFRGEANQVFAKRYSHLGSGLGEVTRTLIFHPGVPLDLVADYNKLKVLFYALLPLGFLPLVSPSAFLLIVPGVAEIFLTNVASLKRLGLLYPFVTLPLFTVAAVLGLSRCTRRLTEDSQRRALWVGSLVVLALSLVAMRYDWHLVSKRIFPGVHHGYYLNRFPLASGFSWEYYLSNEHEAIGRRFIREHVPSGKPLSTEYRFAGHLVDREILEPLENLDRSEFIFIDLYGQPYVESIDSLRVPLRHQDFGVVAFEDGFTLMRRGADRSPNARILETVENRFEAETLTGETGAVVEDHRATNRMARAGRTEEHRSGLLAGGSLRPLAAGSYAAVFRLRAGESPQGAALGRIEVLEAQSDRVVAQREIAPADLGRLREYGSVALPFSWMGRDSVAVRIQFLGTGDLWMDRVEIVRRD